MKAILPFLSLFLAWYCQSGKAQLTVEVRRYHQNSTRASFSSPLEGDYDVVSTFTDPQGFSDPFAWFVKPYANIPSAGISGFLCYPSPHNTCSEELTDAECTLPLINNFANASRFAIVGNYPDCVLEKISMLKDAGYQLMITYSYGDRDRNLDEHTSNSGEEVSHSEFPVVVVTEDYAQYLIDNVTLSSVNGSLMVAFVSANQNMQELIQLAIVTFLTALVLFVPICVCICVCTFIDKKYGNCSVCICIGKCCTCKCGWKRSGHYEVHELHLRELGGIRENGSEEGRGRYEMTSVLSQRERVVRKFDPEVESSTSCPICLDDFSAGDSVEVLPCDSNHIFHSACIEQWLSAQCVCPVCRSLIC